MNVKGTVISVNNHVTDAEGYAIPPLSSAIEVGQFAVNTSDTDPCIFFKTKTEQIVKIPTEAVLVKALTDILGNSAADLDTLRELLAQFEGSANDILPMIVNLTDRIDAEEKSLSAHTGNRSNPHGVTAAQVGALAVGGTAVNSDKLGGRSKEYFGWQEGNWNAVDLDTLKDKTYFGKLYAAKNAPFDYHAFASFGGNNHVMQFNGFEGQLKYRTINVDKISAWFSMWHSGNSNRLDVNWSANKLTAKSGLFEGDTPIPLTIHRTDNDGNVVIEIKGKSITKFLGTSNGDLRFGDNVDLSTSGKIVWHSGNSNLSTVDWTARNINANCLISDGPTNGAFIGGARYMLGEGNTGALIYAYGKSPIRFVTGGNFRTIVTNNGNWGFGTEVPTEKVDVNGNGKFSGNCYVGGNAGFGTNNPTDRVHAVGNIRATEKGIFGGNVESNGSGIFAGDVVIKKKGGFLFSAGETAGALRLNDLQDVKVPADIKEKQVLYYDPAQVNDDGTAGGYTFASAVGVGTGRVSAADIDSLPEIKVVGNTFPASDERLKENIRPLRNAMNILLQLNVKQYNWNQAANELGLNEPTAYGLIAQEVEPLRELVDIVKPLGVGDYLGVDYIKIIPILIAAYQEQHEEIVKLNRKLNGITRK